MVIPITILCVIIQLVCCVDASSYDDSRPIRLLIPDETNTALVSVPEGMDFLRSIEGPVSLISFIGKARSGKSFGLNNLLGVPHDRGFVVGHEYTPETTGAYIWSRPFPETGPEYGRPTVLVVDTEGLGAGPQIFDKAMLLMSAAMSSRIVYHTIEYVYTEDVTKLYGLACLVEHYESAGVLSDSVLPTITWVVHKSEFVKGDLSMTDRDVLFGIWLLERVNHNNNEQIAQFNSTVKIVKNVFSDHTVHLIPSAAPAGVKTTEMDHIPFGDLSYGYVNAMNKLKTEIINTKCRNVPGATDNHHQMSGKDIFALIEAILPAANEGVDQVGDRMVDSIVHKRVMDAKLKFNKAVDGVTYPLEDDALNRILDDMAALALAEYASPITKDSKNRSIGALRMALAASEPDVREKMTSERLRAFVLNSKESDVKCKAAMEQSAALFSREVMTKGGTMQLHDMHTFDAAVESAKWLYFDLAVGPKKNQYYRMLEDTATASRKLMVAELAPMKRKEWFAGLIMVAVTMHFIKVYIDLVQWTPMIVVSFFVGLIRNLSGLFSGIAALNMLGFNTMISFDKTIDILCTIKRYTEGNMLIILSAFTVLTYALLFFYYRLKKLISF
jgi:hypothetical protein